MNRENAYPSDSQIDILKNRLLTDKERVANKQLEQERYMLDRNELSDPLDEASVNVQTSQFLSLIENLGPLNFRLKNSFSQNDYRLLKL